MRTLDLLGVVEKIAAASDVSPEQHLDPGRSAEDIELFEYDPI